MSICGGSDIPFPILVLLLIILLGVVAKVPKQAFFISPASPFPASLRIKLCFCLARCQSEVSFVVMNFLLV